MHRGITEKAKEGSETASGSKVPRAKAGAHFMTVFNTIISEKLMDLEDREKKLSYFFF